MVEYGWSPMFSLQSATITNGKLLGLENKLGVIAPGYLADIIATDTNPIDDIKATEKVTFVMKNGVIYKSK